MNVDRLKEILESHGKWLKDEVGERANLREANLRRANLCRADLRRADLCRADLCGANLREADLCGADLCGADLCGADLCGADLRRANLCGADLCGAKLNEKIIQVGPIGNRRDYTIFFVDQDVIQCGCWNYWKDGSLAEVKKRIDEVYPEDNQETLRYRREYLAAIAMFERLRDDAGKSL